MSTLNVNNINEAGGVDAVITGGVLDSGSLPAGSIIAVESVLKTDTFSAGSVASRDSVAVTGLSITHEVANPSNKLVITAFFGAASTTAGRGRVGIAINDGSGLLALGDSPGNRSATTAGGRVASNAEADIVTMPSITFVHTPGAGSKTYTVHAINANTGTNTITVNRGQGDTDNADHVRTASALTIMEVAG